MGCESGPAAKDRASRRRKAPLRCSGNNFARSWTGYATVFYHPSVMKRLAASAVLQHDSARPYRPYALKFDPALHLYYEGPEDVVG